MNERLRSNTRLLTHPEEVTLCRQAQSGCQAARDLMVESNMRLVTSIAEGFRGKSMTHEDLVQEGVIGLLAAIDKFDPARGTRFSTCATPWIRQAIGRALERSDRMIRLPSHAHGVERSAKRASARFLHREGKSPSREEVVVEAEMDENAARTYQRLTEDAVSIDWAEDSDSSALIDYLGNDEDENPLSQVLRHEWESQIQNYIERLCPREQEVIRARYGFTIQIETRADAKASRQANHNAEKRAIFKLRQMMKEDGFDGGL